MMLEKLEACPSCGAIKRWLYNAQICATCGHGDRFADTPPQVRRLRGILKDVLAAHSAGFMLSGELVETIRRELESST